MTAVLGEVLNAAIGVVKEDRCCAVAVSNDTSILKLENPIVFLKNGKEAKTKSSARDLVGPKEDMLFEFHRQTKSGPKGLVTFRITRGGNKLCYLVIYFFVPVDTVRKQNEYSIVIVDDRSSYVQLYQYLKNNRVTVSDHIAPVRIEFDDGVKFVVTARMDNSENAELSIKVCNDADVVQYEDFFEIGRAVDQIPNSYQTYVVNLWNQAVWVNVGADKMPLPDVSAPAGFDDMHGNEKQVNRNISIDKGCTKVVPETVILFRIPKKAFLQTKAYFSAVAEDGTEITDGYQHELGGYVIINEYGKVYFVDEQRAGLKQALKDKRHLNFAEIRKILTSKAPREKNLLTPIKLSTATGITPKTPCKRRLSKESDEAPPSKLTK